MNQRASLLVVALVLSAGLFGQSGTLKGKAIDQIRNEPIPFASVVILTAPDGSLLGGTSADADGKFTIKQIPPGRWTVKASAYGYITLQIDTVRIIKDKLVILDLELRPKAKIFDEVRIIEYKVGNTYKENTTFPVTAEDIEKMPGRTVLAVTKAVAKDMQDRVDGVRIRDNLESLIEGAWKLIFAQKVTDGVVDFDFPNKVSGSSIKIWSGSHYTSVGKFQVNSSQINLYGGGTYSFEGNIYVEIIKYHFMPNSVGNEVKMILEIRNDILIQKWPVNTDGKIDDNNYFIEKYMRLDESKNP